ncbi:FG-GAP repeat domain-containing protein [Palleronia caenipelagi]|uniref:VCBS repeat-containing protein n=1 Tax=Palleronia caenipelagi TaxID=2489174 RepID=A0A547Q6R4_9RHOB|nr:VCBS repeat-containing protein [Palleronia caenipelagi]TRD22064.1 VCBS repeat-containing protein [Palleronia caenipelagi]
MAWSFRGFRRLASVVTLALLGWQAAAQEAPAVATAARYEGPTNRYPHNIMGSIPGRTDLVVTLQTGGRTQTVTVRQPDHLVFEDFAPRLIDLNRDGRPEIVTVESDRDRGARLTVWDVITQEGRPGLRRGASTEYTGTAFRWLAPIGAADFDGDGAIELAYVEKPHLSRVLKLVRREGDRLIEVDRVIGVTNHAIGQETVQSRIALCSDGPRAVLLDGGGTRMVAVRFDRAEPQVKDLGAAPARMVLGDTEACDG